MPPFLLHIPHANGGLMTQSNFFTHIYALVADIPPGCVMSYGQIAMLLGHPRAAKVVGAAMRLSPAQLSLPCHRVVNRLGEMAPSDVFGAQALQKQLLLAEGVPFLPNGRIDMPAATYHPSSAHMQSLLNEKGGTP